MAAAMPFPPPGTEKQYLFTGWTFETPKTSCGKRLQGAMDARRRACRRTFPCFKCPETQQMRGPVNAYEKQGPVYMRGITMED